MGNILIKRPLFLFSNSSLQPAFRTLASNSFCKIHVQKTSGSEVIKLFSCTTQLGMKFKQLIYITVNQLIFVAIIFCFFVFLVIFAAIYFRGLQNCTKQEQRTVYLLGHFRGYLFSQIFFLMKIMKNIAKVSKAHIPPAVAIRGHTT